MTVRFLPPDEERVPAPRDPNENLAQVVEMRSWLRPAEPAATEDDATDPGDPEASEPSEEPPSEEPVAPKEPENPVDALWAAARDLPRRPVSARGSRVSFAAAAPEGEDASHGDDRADSREYDGNHDGKRGGARGGADRPERADHPGRVERMAGTGESAVHEASEHEAIVTRVQFGAPRGVAVATAATVESVEANEPDAAATRESVASAVDSAGDVAPGSAENAEAAKRSREAAAWAAEWEREASGDPVEDAHGEGDFDGGRGDYAGGGRRAPRETPAERRARREARKAEREAKAEADASDRGPVYDDAVRLLARRARSSGELSAELLALDHSANEVSIIVDEFIESHYLDDLGLARAQCEKLRSSKGASKGQIRRKLRERKLPDHVIDEVCDELDSAEEFDLLREAAEKRAGQMKGLDRQTAERRLMGFLARRGWSGEAVTRAVREALDGADGGGRSSRGPRFH